LSTEQVSPLQTMLGLFAVLEPPGPVLSIMVATTLVPSQTEILFVEELSEFGSTMFPQID
jgi:hypothetical protein